MAVAQARVKLASVLREFAELEEPAESIGDRAIRIGAYPHGLPGAAARLRAERRRRALDE